MIRLVVVLAIAVGVLAMAYDLTSDSQAQTDDSRIETGWKDLDSLLEDGLTEGTHEAISGTLTDSAGFLSGWGDGVVGKVQDVAAP
jgi:hypothetical protein